MKERTDKKVETTLLQTSWNIYKEKKSKDVIVISLERISVLRAFAAVKRTCEKDNDEKNFNELVRAKDCERLKLLGS